MTANHWNNAIPLQPHTFAMREKAAELWNKAKQISDLIHIAFEPVENAADIEFFQDCAADLERWSLQPVVFALPPGECAHVLPEQSCIYCQPHADELELI